MIILGVKERLEWLAKNMNVFFVNIYGVSGSGKTNLALSIAEMINKYYRYVMYVKITSAEEMKELELMRNSVLILDDFTYLASKHSKVIDEFLREIMLIRHKLQRTAIIIITHYLTSSLPALRSSHVRAITSLTSVSEINQLKYYFDLNALWDFYSRYVNNPLAFYSLVNVLGKHYIYKPKLSQYYHEVHKSNEKSIVFSTKPELISFSADLRAEMG